MSKWKVHAIHSLQCLEPEGMNKLHRIIQSQKDGRQLYVIASDRNTGGLKDLVTQAAAHDARVWGRMEEMVQNYQKAVDQLLPGTKGRDLIRSLKDHFSHLEDVLRALWLVKDAGPSTWAFVDELQNRWIAELAAAWLAEQGMSVVLKSTADIVKLQHCSSGCAIAEEKTAEQTSEVLGPVEKHAVVILSGGYGSDQNRQLKSPGRYGGELIAAALASILEASSLTIWHPDSFVMTADPREVPSAQVISSLTYAEATELAFFGARVLHPQVMVPVIRKAIPLYYRNFSLPDHPGTYVSREDSGDQYAVKGFSGIHETALINIEGAGMIGVPGVSSRLFSALRERGISVILISQASSEHSICFAVPATEAEAAVSTAKAAFAEEISRNMINSIEAEYDCSILAAVGENMPGTPGIAASFFGALGKAKINVRAIAQGSSERNISAVIRTKDSKRALRTLHAGFFLSNQTISIGLIGPGLIGGTLLRQIWQATERLKQEFGVDLRVRAIANSKQMLLNDSGIDLEHWEEELASASVPADLDAFTKAVAADYFPHWVVIDCSTSDEIPKRYVEWIERGIHIITPNKKAGTANRSYYDALMKAGRAYGKHFLYETTVGAGLPIIGTLKDLIQTGDTIRKIEGVFSGTLAYLFWKYDGTVPFSELVKGAKDLGYTEPDPRDDLSGMDIVRKTVILAREIGLQVDVDDVPVKSLVPEALQDVTIDEFLDRLSMIDESMLELYREAKKRGEMLKYVGVIDPDASCRVELRGYPKDHAFARITGTDNIVAFTTRRYHDQPLVIQGPGAGPDVTAGGVFADLLRLASFLGARF